MFKIIFVLKKPPCLSGLLRPGLSRLLRPGLSGLFFGPSWPVSFTTYTAIYEQNRFPFFCYALPPFFTSSSTQFRVMFFENSKIRAISCTKWFQVEPRTMRKPKNKKIKPNQSEENRFSGSFERRNMEDGTGCGVQQEVLQVDRRHRIWTIITEERKGKLLPVW